MINGKRIAWHIVCIVLGVVLVILGMTKLDSYWSGMGMGLTVVGVLQLIRIFRLRKNEAYREKMEVELSDERNRFLRCKAWAWAGYLFILIAAVSAIVLKAFGQDLLSVAASCMVSLMVLLYWICYLFLRKKY